MSKIMAEIRGMKIDMNQNMNQLNSKLDTNMSQITQVNVDMKALKDDLASVKADMVSGPQFEELESRIHKLETNVANPDHPDMKSMQDQLDRLDPAQK